MGDTDTIEPFTVDVGPVPVTLCNSGCPLPILPGLQYAGSVTVTVTVGTETYSETVPLP